MSSVLEDWMRGSGVPIFTPSDAALDSLARSIERVLDFDGARFLDEVLGAVEQMTLVERFGRSHPDYSRYARVVGEELPGVATVPGTAFVDLGRIPTKGLPKPVAAPDRLTRHLLAFLSLHRLGYRPGVPFADPRNPQLPYRNESAILRLPLLFRYDPSSRSSTLRRGPRIS